MKKIITLSLITCITSFLFAQAQEFPFKPFKASSSRLTGYVLDSTRYWLFDSATQTATISRRQINTNDANQNTPISFSQTWNGTAWTNKSNYIQTYDAHNNIVSQLWQKWNGSAWSNYILTSYTYDAHDNQIIRLFQDWDGTNWINSTKDSSVYDANNNNISTLNLTWSGSAWTNNRLNLYTFNTNNKQTSNLLLAWSSGAWVPAYRDTLLYGANGKVRLDSTLSWVSGVWKKAGNFISTYDASDRIIEYALQGFYLSGQPAPIEQKTVFTYYPFDYQASYVTKFWNGSQWLNTDSLHYYYSQVTSGIDQPGLDLQKLVIYPNPASATFNINMLNQTEGSLLELYDALGAMVQSHTLTPHSAIDIAGLPSGMYFVRVRNGSKTIAAQKIVKE